MSKRNAAVAGFDIGVPTTLPNLQTANTFNQPQLTTNIQSHGQQDAINSYQPQVRFEELPQTKRSRIEHEQVNVHQFQINNFGPAGTIGGPVGPGTMLGGAGTGIPNMPSSIVNSPETVSIDFAMTRIRNLETKVAILENLVMTLQTSLLAASASGNQAPLMPMGSNMVGGLGGTGVTPTQTPLTASFPQTPMHAFAVGGHNDNNVPHQAPPPFLHQRSHSDYSSGLSSAYPELLSDGKELTEVDTKSLPTPPNLKCACKGDCAKGKCACRKHSSGCHPACACASSPDGTCKNVFNNLSDRLFADGTITPYACFSSWASSQPSCTVDFENLRAILMGVTPYEINARPTRAVFEQDAYLMNWTQRWCASMATEKHGMVQELMRYALCPARPPPKPTHSSMRTGDNKQNIGVPVDVPREHYYSFCLGDWVETKWNWHCMACKKCQDGREWHCGKCNKCRYPNHEPCQKCGGISYQYRRRGY